MTVETENWRLAQAARGKEYKRRIVEAGTTQRALALQVGMDEGALSAALKGARGWPEGKEEAFVAALEAAQS